MKKQVYYLRPEAETYSVIRWHFYIAGRAVATTDLIGLLEEYYFFN